MVVKVKSTVYVHWESHPVTINIINSDIAQYHLILLQLVFSQLVYPQAGNRCNRRTCEMPRMQNTLIVLPTSLEARMKQVSTWQMDRFLPNHLSQSC